MRSDDIATVIKTAEENNFTHAIVCYTLSESDEGVLMNINHIAMYATVPYFIDIVDLFRMFVMDEEKYSVTEEMLANMLIRVDTIETLVKLLSNSYVSNETSIKQVYIENNKETDDGWTYGVAGNANINFENTNVAVSFENYLILRKVAAMDSNFVIMAQDKNGMIIHADITNGYPDENVFKQKIMRDSRNGLISDTQEDVDGYNYIIDRFDVVMDMLDKFIDENSDE